MLSSKYKNLVLIGNGFDRWQGLSTSYEDFRRYYTDHAAEIMRRLGYEKLHTEKSSEKQYDITPVELIYGNPFNPSALQKEFFWTFENSIANLDDQLLNLYFGKNDKDLYHLQETVKQAQKILRIAFCDWIASIHVPKRTNPKYFSNDCYFVNFNYTDTLERCFGVSVNEIFHIHGSADKPESIIVGHSTHPELPFSELVDQRFIHPKSQRLKGLYLIESALYETDKHIQDNIDNMCKIMVLDGLNIEEIENIYVLGHSFGVPDIEYFDFLVKVTTPQCDYNEMSALWQLYKFDLGGLDEDKLLEGIRLNILYAVHHRNWNLGRRDDLFPEYTRLEKLLNIGELYTEAITRKAKCAVRCRFMFEQASRTKKVLEELYALKGYQGTIPESVGCASVFRLADYIDGGHKKRIHNAKWHISFYSDEDRKRIESVMQRIGCHDYELFSSIDECMARITK